MPFSCQVCHPVTRPLSENFQSVNRRGQVGSREVLFSLRQIFLINPQQLSTLCPNLSEVKRGLYSFPEILTWTGLCLSPLEDHSVPIPSPHLGMGKVLNGEQHVRNFTPTLTIWKILYCLWLSTHLRLCKTQGNEVKYIGYLPQGSNRWLILCNGAQVIYIVNSQPRADKRWNGNLLSKCNFALFWNFQHHYA